MTLVKVENLIKLLDLWGCIVWLPLQDRPDESVQEEDAGFKVGHPVVQKCKKKEKKIKTAFHFNHKPRES